MSSSLGFGKGKSSGKTRPLIQSTGFSNITGSTFNLDPRVRELQEGGLLQLGGLKPMLGESIADYRTRIGDLRSRYLGNEGALTEAIVNPVLQQNAAAIGATQQAVGSRRIGGSSFGMQSMNQARFDAARNEANARAFATAANIQAEMGFNDAEMNAVSQYAQQIAAITGMELDTAMNMAALEFQKFGVGGSKTTGSQSGLQFGFKAGAPLFSNQKTGEAGWFGR